MSAWSGSIDESIEEIIALKKAIEDLKSQLPKWIKCSERLPEEYSDATESAHKEIIVMSDEGVISATITKWVDNGKLDYYFAPVRDCSDIIKVTHWMPLPEPPK